MGRPLHSLKGLLYDMLSCLGKYLHCHIIGNHVSLDKGSHKIILCLRCRRETNLDFLKAHFYQHTEEIKLFIKTHGLDKRLIAVTQIHGAPDGRLCDMILLHPVVGALGRHKILYLVFIVIFHGNLLMLYIGMG